MFVVLFGLSMDYHVFILSRVKEAVDRGMRTEDAVSYGIKSTAGVVTSAAFVMVAVFAVFGTLQIIEFKEMGVGLAVAVFLDATIVRAVLLPATMKLLGEHNWYLPRSLELAAQGQGRRRGGAREGYSSSDCTPTQAPAPASSGRRPFRGRSGAYDRRALEARRPKPSST